MEEDYSAGSAKTKRVGPNREEGSIAGRSASPEMSVVVVTDRYETIRKTLRHLRAQTVHDRLEIVIVAPCNKELALDGLELEGFFQVRVVEVSDIEPLPRARAAGVRAAGAPLLAFVESHSYPAPGWAEALIKAHGQPCAVVGPAMANANPGTPLSWAGFLIDYGPWIDPAPAASMDHVPGHNSSYKRSILLECGPELEAMLEAESVLHWDLKSRGYQLYLEPSAKMYHLNVSLRVPWLKERFHVGRQFAAARARRWSGTRRLLYAVGTPAVVPLRLRRTLRQIKRCGRSRDLLPGVLPSLILGLIITATGQMVGYAFGAGSAHKRLCHIELHKVLHVAERERLTDGG
jgi:hypothetical protein